MMVFRNAISHYEAFSLVVTNTLRESIRCRLSCFEMYLIASTKYFCGLV